MENIVVKNEIDIELMEFHVDGNTQNSQSSFTAENHSEIIVKQEQSELQPTTNENNEGNLQNLLNEFDILYTTFNCPNINSVNEVQRNLPKRRSTSEYDVVYSKRHKRIKTSISPTPSYSNSNMPSSYITDDMGNDEKYTYCNEILLRSGKYFKILEIKSGAIIAACYMCDTKVKGSLRVNSNFGTHLKTKHPRAYQEFLEIKAQKKFVCNSWKITNKQHTFDQKVLAFITSSCTTMPLSVVEHKSFRDLFEGTGLTVANKHTIESMIVSKSETEQRNLKEKLKSIKYFCTTVDVWAVAGGHRSFFGYTIHWINECFKIESAALACRRFSGAHDKEIYGETISKICNEFGLNEQNVICTLTGNGFNSLKAFREFGVKGEHIFFGSNNEEVVEGDDSEIDVELEFENIELNLPNYLRCVSHTLNVLSSTDFMKILKKYESLHDKHMQAISRCESLWEKCHTPESSEIIKDCIGMAMPTPMVTKWNSLYGSIKTLLTHKQKLAELCKKLNIPQFSSSELDYLEEYTVFMEPIANAISFLQAESNIYFGYFLPTIITIKVQYERLQHSSKLIYFQLPCNEMLDLLIRRFIAFYAIETEAYDAVVATVTCPKIKTKFLMGLQKTAPHFTNEKLVSLLMKYGKEFEEVSSSTAVEENSPQPHEFFDFGEDLIEANNGSGLLKLEINAYLNEKVSSFESLDKYPIIKKLFYKYNTPLTSSTPVERLLSFAAIVNVSKKQDLESDSNFERLVLLRNLQKNKIYNQEP